MAQEVIFEDGWCKWVPEGLPFALLKMADIENVAVDYDNLSILTSKSSFNRAHIEFLENDVFSCPWDYPPPVRPEHVDSPSNLGTSWGLKGQVLKRPYFKRPVETTISTLRQGLFITLSHSFGWSYSIPPGSCGCNSTSNIMVPASGSGSGMVTLIAGPCDGPWNANPYWTPCDDYVNCASHAENYWATGELGWESSFNEQVLWVDDTYTTIKIAIDRVYSITHNGVKWLCANGEEGTSQCGDTTSLSTFERNCFDNVFAGAYGGTAVLEWGVFSLPDGWEGAVDDDDYYGDYKVLWPPGYDH